MKKMYGIACMLHYKLDVIAQIRQIHSRTQPETNINV